jgi:hypothetical protein
LFVVTRAGIVPARRRIGFVAMQVLGERVPEPDDDEERVR